MHEDDLSRAKSIIKDFKATSFERNSAFHEMIILGVIGGIFLVSSLGAFIATCLPGCAVGAFYLSGALLGFAGAATLTICRVQYNNFSSMETQYETAKTKCAVERAKFFDDVAGVTELNKDNNNSFRRFINNSKQFGVQLGNNIPMRFLD